MRFLLKPVGLFLALLCFSAAFYTPAAAAQARRIALLPIYNGSGHRAPQLEEYLMRELKKNMHVPLNNSLNIVTFLPESDIEAAISKLNYHKPTAMFLDLVARELDADITVCVIIDRAYQYTVPRFEETYLISGVTLRLIARDNKLFQPIKAKASASYCDTYALSGTLQALAEDASYSLFKKANLKRTIFPLTK